MLLKCIIYYSLLFVVFFLPVFSNAQGIGAPIINITFGEGESNPGPPLPIKNANFNYTTDSCPPPGYYTITNSLYRCPDHRIGRTIDHTPSSDFGYTMLVNDTASSTSKILYIDTLKDTDTAGCADTAYHVMKVEDNCYIAVPSAFTPNGDGLNDYLYPLNAYKATQLIFRVFNRNGQLVFETRDWTKKWDGTFKGNPLTTAIFVWELSYTDPENKKVFLKGSTLLIR